MSEKILVVEDEHDISTLLSFNLESRGYTVETADNGETGLLKAQSGSFDLVLLDIMLPGINGLNICRTLRSETKTEKLPIILLSALGEEEDIIKGLDLGADDYISKPFQISVLMARVRRLLKRQEKKSLTLLQCNELSLDLDRHSVKIDNQDVELTSSEFNALHYFMKSPGRVFTRNQIMEAVHGDGYMVSPRAIDVLIVGLRKKLKHCGEWVQTVRGVGYRFTEEP